MEECHILTNDEGRPSGEALLRLASKDHVDEALKKNKQHLGSRYTVSGVDGSNTCGGGGMEGSTGPDRRREGSMKITVTVVL